MTQEESTLRRPIEVISSPMAGPLEREGFLSGVVALSASVTERTTRAIFLVVRESRAEVVDRLLASIDWLDESQQGVLRLSRRITESGGSVATDLIDASEHLALGTLRLARDTARGLSDVIKRVLVAEPDRAPQPRASA